MTRRVDGNGEVERPHGSGFTLIDVLIVIALTALLTGLLAPVLILAKERARQTECASNMKQIVIAFNVYADSYDENATPFYVYTPVLGQPLGNRVDFYELLQPYLSTPYFHLFCPSRKWPPGAPEPDPPDDIYTSYTLNGVDDLKSHRLIAPLTSNMDFGEGWGSVDPTQAVSLAEVEIPSNLILLADGIYVSVSATNLDFCSPRWYSDGQGSASGFVYARHKNRFNTGFLDGHVRAMSHSTPEQWVMHPSEMTEMLKAVGCPGW